MRLMIPFLMILISLNSFADTKFHYGDKVKFTLDFYGACKGTILKTQKARKKELDCYKKENDTTYYVTDNECNGKYVPSDYIICESGLEKIND